LQLSKKQAEPLGSGVKDWKLLRQDTKVYFCGHHEEFKELFSRENVVFCNHVCSIMEVLGHEYNPDQWRLFRDSSKVSLKVVLLHNGTPPPVPLSHAPNMKEIMIALSYGWGKFSMTNLSGSYVVI